MHTSNLLFEKKPISKEELRKEEENQTGFALYQDASDSSKFYITSIQNEFKYQEENSEKLPKLY